MDVEKAQKVRPPFTIFGIVLNTVGNSGKTRSEQGRKKWPFCFGMVLYFMLEALDAFKIKYQVFMLNVHRAQKRTIQSVTKQKLL